MDGGEWAVNVDDVIRAHREWKDRFRVAMAKREQLNVAEIAVDNCCVFGKWLHGIASAELGKRDEYPRCVTLHAVFHQEAGKVAALVNTGDFLGAERMMAHGTSYAAASQALTKSVIALFSEANRADQGAS